MTVGHNRWHEKIVCCLDMLILWPYINWRVWSTLDTLIHITSLGTMTTTSNIYHRYISSAHLDPPWDLSFEINVVLTGLNSKYLCTRGKWLTAVLRSSASSLPGMFSVWANELLMGQVCLAPGDRRETGDCPRHGHQWSRDTWWWLLTWTQCYQALCIVLSQLHWVWWPLISQITANNDAAPHIMVNSESPFRRLKLR